MSLILSHYNEPIEEKSKFYKITTSFLKIPPLIVQNLQILFDFTIFKYHSFLLSLFGTFFLALGFKNFYWFITRK